jgi:HSP20 family protein
MTRMGTLWSPWREMNRLRREVDHLINYDGWPTSRGPAAFPAVNAWENEQGLVLTAEIPGIDPSKLDVSLEKDILTISGERLGVASAATEENYVRRERWFEPFKRTVELPFDLNPDKCDASYERGVLTVRLERAPELQPKKLTIKAG